MSSTWKVINDVLNKSKQRNSQKRFEHNGQVYDTSKNIAGAFNEYFVNIGPDQASKIQPSE